MSAGALESGEHQAAPPAIDADSLADSVIILLVLTVVQRLVGLLRSVLFCRWLDTEQLGQWDVAYGFLLLAAPVAVLGLPGSFGRYVEHYRQRGQLRTFLRRTGGVAMVFALAGVATIAAGHRWFSRLIFGTSDQGELVLLLAVAMGALVVHNFLTSLFTALRMVRLVSRMQFVNSLAFALVGVVLVAGWQPSAAAVVAAFAAACALTSASGLVRLRQAWHDLPAAGNRLLHSDLWGRLMPFALWLWATNWLANLFSLADRYLIVHASGLPTGEALSLVGQYHSSRVVPLLFIGVAEMLAAMITPHLTHDWESGQPDAVSRRLRLMLKLAAFGLTAGGVLVLFGSPLLFAVVLGGKYSAGLAVLPWTLTYCAWSALAMLAVNYLWCAEQARLTSVTLLIGLVVNVSLNGWLLPRYGLPGAVAATASAHLLMLVLTCAFACRHGLRLDPSTWVLMLLPLSLCAGPWLALALLLAVALQAASRKWLLHDREKERLINLATEYWARCRQRADV